MHYTIHSLGRLSQRGISHAMAELVYAYGEAQGNKVILNQKMTSARLIEARAERSALLKALDVGSGDLVGDLHLVAALEAEIRNLVKLLDKHETAVVVSGDTLITAYGIH